MNKGSFPNFSVFILSKFLCGFIYQFGTGAMANEMYIFI